MIEIKITADTVKDAQAEMAALLAGNGVTPMFNHVNTEKVPDVFPEGEAKENIPDDMTKAQMASEKEKPAPKKKAEKVTPPAPVEEPIMTQMESPASPQVATPNPVVIINTPTPTPTPSAPATSTGPVDPFAKPAVAITPAPSQPVQTQPDPTSNGSPVIPGTPITYENLKHKVAKMPDKRSKVRDAIKNYKKADGSPCISPSDLQEKDFEAFYVALDTL